MRAETMTFFDSVIPDASAAITSVREQGKKFVGVYCVFAPQELIVAADAVPVTLCSTREEPIADGEKYLPRNFCPLIKSSYGFAITGKCAFFNNSDFIIGETTCDGKKKMFELMAGFKPTVVLELPQSAKGEAQKQYLALGSFPVQNRDRETSRCHHYRCEDEGRDNGAQRTEGPSKGTCIHEHGNPCPALRHGPAQGDVDPQLHVRSTRLQPASSGT